MNWAKFDTGDEESVPQVLWEDGERSFCRTWHSGTGGARHRCMAVITATTARGSVMRLAHEYALKDYLDGAWALRPLELVQEPGRTTLVLEDPGGELLSQLIGTPIAVEHFLWLAIGITAAVLKMHQQGLVHKDIKPANVLVGRTDGAMRLTGFGIASRLPRERQPLGPPELIAGTLAYMAPEQTGRMNRSIDSRSDLYALGVTFYEMLTGRLPFYADDAVEWIHCHVARQAQSPSEQVPGVLPALSAIVMKLLAKAAEDRYQTAAGLRHDLQRCLSDWAKWHRVEPFALGECDIPSRLLIPEKLYGRAREIEILFAAFDDVVTNGMPQQVLVSGYSGIGKSAVVHELHRVLDVKRALFASGKFDQYKRDVPYATLAQAFQSLIRELLGRTESEFHDWRNRLLQAVGPNGLLMVDLVPELKVVIGEQPAVPELPPLEAKARFQLVFRRFLGVFARAEHPLVLFVDDMQWLDVATLDLVESLLTAPDVRHLLLVGAYRDNEVGIDHPLVHRLDALRQAGANTRHVVLAPLGREDLTELLTDTVHCDAERARPLAQLILAKTGGNPFFTHQFISTLVDESLLTFDHDCAQWCWELSRIDAKGYTENVADLMAGALRRLPVEAQQVLQLLACVGNSGGIGFLSMLRERTQEEVHAQLWKARHAELVVYSEGAYRFVHDRVREAAYSMIPHEQRAEVHLRIGKLLTVHTLPGRLEEAIFEVAAQFDRCTPLLSSRDAREQVAGLYLVAGKRAKAAAAHVSALRYLVSGAALLDEDRWERRHDLAFQLELHRAECELLTADFQAADERLAMLSGRAASTMDRSVVECLRVDLFTTLDRPDRAVAVCLDYLGSVGIEWSPHPSDAQAQREYEQVWSRLGSRAIEDLVELPVMSEPASLATLDVLTKALVPALITDANLLCLTACRIANLSLQHGNSDGSCLGYQWFGMLARTRFGNPNGFRFGRLGFELVEKKGLRRFQGSTCTTYVQFVPLWTGHIRTCCDLLRNAFEATNRIGDLTYATYSLDCLSAMLLMAGNPLAEVQCSAEHALEFAKRAGFGFMTDVLITRGRLIRTLRGLASTFGSLDGEGFDEPSFERHLAGDPRLMVAECWYWIAKLQARFRAGDYPAAVEASEKARRLVTLLPPVFTETAEYHFYGALCHTASVPSRTAEGSRKHLEAAAAHHKQIEAWALNCPENFENRAALVGAELARIEGRELDAERLYERAIRSARANAFISNEALANELAARFHEGRGLETIASAYRAAARSCYLRWGADGKVRQLDQQYPQLRQETERPDATRTALTADEQLDLATVTKVLQALSGEIVLDKLIATIMRVAVEHAGAQRGLLILPQEDACRIQAEAGIIGDELTVSLRQAEVTAADLPGSALHYVLRTRQAVLLHDACAEHPFSSDDYVRRHRARSVLCLPLQRLNRLVGVIYLENNLAPGAFTPARIAVLNLLASEAAVALEHARLFRDLQEREAKVRRLVDSNIIGIVIWHADGRILDTNDEFLRIVGHAREDLVSGRVRWTDLTPPEWRERDERALEGLSKVGALQAYEKELFRKDGTRVPVMVGAATFGGTADEGVAFVVDLTERKRAEQALREMEREARLIVDTIPGLVATLTTAGAVEAVNKELVEYCGQGLDGIRQWGTNGTVHSEDMPGVGQVFTQAIASGEPYDFEARIRRFDGVYRWCQVRGLPLRDTAGQVVRWYVLLSDIDDRKRAEHALLASERNLKLIVDTIPALAWSARPDGSADFFNQHYLDFIGLSTQQAEDWGWTAAVHPDDLDSLAMTWQRILASGQPGDAEARLRRQDGEYRWCLFRANPQRDDTGNIVKWYAANTDIEDRKRAEAELRRAYDSFADGQRLSRTGNFTADIVADEHTWSAELYRIFEIDPATKITVQAIRALIHPEDLPSFDAGFARSLGGTDFDLVFRIVTSSGNAKHVHAVGRLVELVAGRPLFIGAIQDVTESKVAEEALNTARSDLAHVARVTTLNALTASIAHEVNQPLSGIITNAGTCLRMLDADPPNIDGARETAKRTIRDGNRASDVILRLRALFSKKEITLESLDLNEATREVVALSLSDLQRNRVILRSELADDLPRVTGDRVQLQQVIMNLLRNASDAMVGVDDRPRQVLVSTAREIGDRVRVTVRDAGVGLEGQSMEKLFDPFYTTKSDGMGIGLSVSRSIVERHHGRLWAEPNEGPGATFSFSIPVSAE